MLFDEVSYREELSLLVLEFEDDLKKIRSGRASKELLENISVKAYGSDSKLNSLSNLVFEGPLSVLVKVWDKSLVPEVKKSLDNANLGASVNDIGDFIRINFFPLTEELRRESVKELGKTLEKFKIKMRLVRQDYIQNVKSIEGVSEDEVKLSLERIQRILDEEIKTLDDISSKKESELLSIN